jgi:hypothetical protein
MTLCLFHLQPVEKIEQIFFSFVSLTYTSIYNRLQNNVNLSIPQDIPNITSNTIDNLRKLNINSVYQLAVQSPLDLAMEISDALFDIDSASSLISNAKKILTENEILSKEFSTGDDLLEKRNKISRYTTGSSHFDAFLNGGFETQSSPTKLGC